MPGGAAQTRKQLDGWQEWAKQRGAKGLAYVLVGDDGELGGPVAKNLSEKERAEIAARVGAGPGDCIFFAAGEAPSARALLGAARLEIGRRCELIDTAAWSFVWVVDAPVFEAASKAHDSGDVAVGAGAWTAVHHAFTSPKPEWIDRFEDDPAAALSDAYDLVCNGNEIGGGSIRIHRRDIQQRVFDDDGAERRRAARRSSGFCSTRSPTELRRTAASPSGWDRVCALLAGADSIREVIAFPKAASGIDSLTGAPAPITDAQRAEAGRRRRAAAPQRLTRTTGRHAPTEPAGGVTDLFESAAEDRGGGPLAARMRPQSIDELVGQEHLLAERSPLRRLVEGDTRVVSLILFGPPGTGKTTIAHLVSRATGRRFAELSAVTAGVKDVRRVIDEARRRLGMGEPETVLFVDEVHRFSKTQQDALLPAVENGWVVLIAATTENPHFALVSPLLSRSLLVTLQPLGDEALETLVRRAVDDDRGLAGCRRRLRRGRRRDRPAGRWRRAQGADRPRRGGWHR